MVPDIQNCMGQDNREMSANLIRSRRCVGRVVSVLCHCI